MLSGLADHGILPLGVYLNGVRGWVAHTAFNAGKLTQRRSGPAGGATRTGVPPARGINTKALEAMKQRRRGDRLIPGSRTLATD